MHNVILGPKEINVRKRGQTYEQMHEDYISEQQRLGKRVEIHESPVRLAAYINHGRWLADCECGAGNAVDVDDSVAFCFACGARHQVDLPPDRQDIEAALLARSFQVNRNWTTETVGELLVENVEHGVGG